METSSVLPQAQPHATNPHPLLKVQSLMYD